MMFKHYVIGAAAVVAFLAWQRARQVQQAGQAHFESLEDPTNWQGDSMWARLSASDLSPGSNNYTFSVNAQPAFFEVAGLYR
jgi:hypothetical protein